METNKINQSKLFVTTPIEAKDEWEEKYEKCYTTLQSLITGVSEKEAHDALNASVCKASQNHEEVSLGLLVALLTEPPNASRYYRDLTYITRDGLSLVQQNVSHIISEKYSKLQETCRTQLIWMIKEMIKNSVAGVDQLCFILLRQIAGGDISHKNIWLAESMLDMFVENRAWVERNPVLLATIVYTYLRLIVDHGCQSLLTLRQREVDFCILLLRERFVECMMIGRDLVRLLQNVARIPEFERLWKDILYNPSSLASTFTGVLQLLQSRTSRRFLQSRLTPDMERKICYLTSQVKFGQQKRYQDWFQRQYLATPESQSLRCDLIRYICGVIHPSNEVLCSDIIPRWAVIGWLLTTCTSNVAASNAKLSLFYDWLFFDPEKDNIMNIEPAILVMYHSMRPHPAITATLLDFLCRIMSNFCVPLAREVRQGIYTSLRQILEKRVLPSLSPLFDNPKLDRELRSMIRDSFAEFCTLGEGKPEEPIPIREPVEVLNDGNFNSTPNNNENEAQFSEDEDDIPLGKLRIRDMKFRPIRESSKVEQININDHIEQLNGDVKTLVLNLQNEKDSEIKCEIMEKLLQAVLQEEDFDQDSASTLGLCLAQILNEEFVRKIFPQEMDDETLEDSMGTPLFVMFRNLCQTPEEDPSRQPLLMILAEMTTHQQRLGYLLLYFLKASKVQDNRMSSYRDYVKSLESKDLATCLLSDLRLCQEDDVRMFCYIIPDIYTQFPNIAIGNAELLNLIVSCIDPTQLQDLVCHILQGNMVMFRKDSFLSVLNASLEWESFEQFCLWQLIAAHNIPLDYILPILPKLEFQAHAEALTSILLLLKQEKPTAELLKHIMCRDVKLNDQFVVSVLKYWSQEHEEKLAELIGSQLSKSGLTPNKRKRQQVTKSQGPTVDQTLAHLDQLRQNCKQTSFFNQETVQSSLIQVQSSCSDAQKSKYSDLFALVEDIDDIKVSKSVRTGGRGKGIGPKSTAKSKQLTVDSESDMDSSEDEETLKPKPPRKKKRTVGVEFDSD
ncbi:integrator complex subunit 3 isoform X1 [Centruroides vittatus]|uniref:integrator complex subunit 3-like n=1 Tax=Centruroides sculpturatus TaxID=218467 RepID=UPI000C6D9DF0|nr:integrator complex subunit 3-like [Centruroides sculpturatus]